MNTSPLCRGCGGPPGPERLYFGSHGPFCSNACRDEWIAKSDRFVNNVRQLVTRGGLARPKLEPFTEAEARIARENAQRQVMLCMDALSRAGELVIRIAYELDKCEDFRDMLVTIGVSKNAGAVLLPAKVYDELREALAEHRKARADLDVAVEHARKVGIT